MWTWQKEMLCQIWPLSGYSDFRESKKKKKQPRFRRDKLRIKSNETNAYIHFSHFSIPVKLNKYNGTDQY